MRSAVQVSFCNFVRSNCWDTPRCANNTGRPEACLTKRLVLLRNMNAAHTNAATPMRFHNLLISQGHLFPVAGDGSLEMTNYDIQRA